MDQTKKTRKEIYVNDREAGGQNSEAGWQEMEEQLQTHAYADATEWRRFLHLLLPALGLSLLVSGILFFFAYNWADLPKFAKLGIIEGVLVIAVSLVLFTRWSVPMKQIILTGASFLIGVLFAVYGQIYQTGANAYDFFLCWTLFVTLWVAVSAYPPLWLLWIGLVNVTLYLYKEQIALSNEGMEVLLNNAHTLVCTLTVILAEGGHIGGRIRKRTDWFINTVALAAFISATVNAMSSILDHYTHAGVTLPLALALFVGSLFFGFRQRRLFYIATAPFCALLLLDAALLQLFEKQLGVEVILLLGLVLIAGTTGLVSLIVKLKKQGYGSTTE